MAKTDIKGPEFIEVKTEVNYLPISSRKLRLMVKEIKVMNPNQALKKLAFWNKKGARFLSKAIKTVLADAENNFSLEAESLSFKEILVNEGPRLKRRDKSHGARFNGGLIMRPRSHLIIKVVGEKNNGSKS